MLLEGKRLLITGVLRPQSIAFATAQVCQELGAEVVLTSFGRAMSLTEKSARRLQTPADVLGRERDRVQEPVQRPHRKGQLVVHARAVASISRTSAGVGSRRALFSATTRARTRWCSPRSGAR